MLYTWVWFIHLCVCSLQIIFNELVFHMLVTCIFNLYYQYYRKNEKFWEPTCSYIQTLLLHTSLFHYFQKEFHVPANLWHYLVLGQRFFWGPPHLHLYEFLMASKIFSQGFFADSLLFRASWMMAHFDLVFPCFTSYKASLLKTYRAWHWEYSDKGKDMVIALIE